MRIELLTGIFRDSLLDEAYPRFHALGQSWKLPTARPSISNVYMTSSGKSFRRTFQLSTTHGASGAPDAVHFSWCSITAAWLAYHEKYLNDELLPDEDEKHLLGALIVISTGVADVAKFNVREEVGRRLLQCYDDLRKE